MIKQIHKYNLYKSLNTFVWESEEGEIPLKPTFLGCHSFYITPKYVFLSPNDQIYIENCFEKLALVFMMGLFKVTQNAPDV